MAEIKPEQVPWEAHSAAMLSFARDGDASKAIAAALNAWPGAWPYKYHDTGERAFILPLPTTGEKP